MDNGKFASESGVKLAIGGINVKFPVKPYPSQLSMMSMIIRGLQKGQHCLLESPTGSGKSLALLCSALAWQQAQYDKADEDLISRLKSEAEKESQPCICGKGNKSVAPQEDAPTTSKHFGDCKAGKATSVIDLCTPEEGDDDFRQSGKPAREPKPKSDAKSYCLACSSDNAKCKDIMEEEKQKKPRVPKIWFGTRTHKQIAQIAKELGRTSYDSAKMTILSSRQHSCIHPAVMKSANKNEECRDLRRGTHTSGAKCAFYQNVHRMKHHDQLTCAGMSSAWDLEELVGLGKTIKACPFYSARELVSTSNIIFCPYNYLIDPMIRTQMQINPNNQVIILDEGHNIEDCAREAGSFTLTETDLANTTADLEFLINDGVKTEEHRPLHLLCMRLGQWINQHSRNLKSSTYETSSEVWYGRDIIDHLREWGISEVTLPLLEGNFSAATDLGEEDIETAKLLHSSSQATLGGLFNVLRYLMAENNKYCDDYRITVIRQSVFGPVPPKRTREGWVTLHKKSQKHFITNLHFWCLNPAVAFNDLSKAHCIILTSGTLSPMSSFSSELGLSFPIQLEANHVIHDSQVWVGSVGKGPRGVQLEATYKNTDKFEFQDELGELVNHVCHIIPYGILCFFSSYSMLQKLQERWKTTGLWSRIQEVKVVVCEPRSSNKEEFDSLLQSFYDVIEESTSSDDITGALLLAVCRGKVSEGLDFADNNARAVITVGIPFPSIKDKQVELKRKYNDMHKTERGLLSGAQWYEIQAFRAMNQALGRCIRHKNDWGALIIVDDRFCKNPQKYSKGLSKWVRQKMRPQATYDCAISNITAFVQGWSSKQDGLIPPQATSPKRHCTPTLDGSSHGLRTQEASLTIKTQEPTTFTSQHDAATIIQNQLDVKSTMIKKISSKLKSAKLQDFFMSPNTDKKELQKPEPKPPESSDACIKPEPTTELQKSNTFQSRISKAESTEKQKSIKIGNDFSGDEIEYCSDEDFQPYTVSKTQKHSAKKNKEKTVKVSNTEPKTEPIESLDEITVNHLMDEDLFDCTIPATPEKEDLTIIPESPASAKKKPATSGKTNSNTRQALDFHDKQPDTPRKRKSSSPSHTDALTPSLKRKGSSSRKKSHGESEESSAAANGASIEEGSCELLPRSRRRKKSKSTLVNSCQQSSVVNVQCKNCKMLLHSSPKPLENEKVEFKYLSTRVKNGKKARPSCKVYIVDKTPSTMETVALTIHEEKGSPLELNSYWCSEDGRCYQAYKCLNCSQIVAYCVVSDPAFHHKLIFPCKLVKTEAVS